MTDLTPSPDLRPPLGASLDPQTFFCTLSTTLAGALEDVIGYEDAAAFVASVGDIMGMQIAALYRLEQGALPQDPARVAALACDLKARIGGSFSVEAVEADEVQLTGCRCPFGAQAAGRPSLCMMTTNVLGRIAAEATGYAAVRVDESLAMGHGRCAVSLRFSPDRLPEGYHEFFG